MKSAVLFVLALASVSARADFCVVCGSIYHSQTIPLDYPVEVDDDSQTEAGLPAYLYPKKTARMYIPINKISDELSTDPLIRDRVPPQPVYSASVQAGQQVNAIRAQYGLSSLQLDEKLNRDALRFAKELSERYSRGLEISHNSRYGDTGSRLSQAGVPWSYVAENIARNPGGAQAVVNAWMNSPGHKKNLLSPNFRRQGMAEYNGFWVNIFTD